MKKKKLIFFSAHPDDHLLCAGTLMWLKQKDFSLLEVLATGGEKGTWFLDEKRIKTTYHPQELKKQRKKEFLQALKMIGITKTVFLGLKDSEISFEIKTVNKIIKIIRKEKPQIVITLNRNDYHRDHCQVAEMVLEAVKRACWDCFLELGQPHLVPIVLMTESIIHLGKSHVLVDITGFWKKKKNLYEIYSSQMDKKTKRFVETIDFYRGFLSKNKKCDYGERFEIPEEFPLNLNILSSFFV